MQQIIESFFSVIRFNIAWWKERYSFTYSHLMLIICTKKVDLMNKPFVVAYVTSSYWIRILENTIYLLLLWTVLEMQQAESFSRIAFKWLQSLIALISIAACETQFFNMWKCDSKDIELIVDIRIHWIFFIFINN